MKSIFYTQLFSDRDLSIGARIVYSQIVFRAVACISESFDNRGDFDTDALAEANNSWRDDYSTDSELRRDLSCTRNTIVNCKSALSYHGVLDESERVVFVRDGMMDRFFELRTETGLWGWELVVYSFIHHQTKKYKRVDTYRAKLAELFGISETRVSHIVGNLIEEGWVGKEKSGRNWRLYCRK